MGMSKGRSAQTKTVRYRRKRPSSKYCNRRNIRKYLKRISEITETLRKLEGTGSGG